MPVSINNTTLTFNDATTQTTSGVTSVGVSTGLSSTGGKTPTLTNTGVTSVTAGTGISVSASTGGVTITNTSSVATNQLVKAWVTYNGSGGASIGGSFNVSSVSRNSNGDYTVNFSSALPSANYTPALSTVGANTGNLTAAFVIKGSQGSGATLKSTTQLGVQSGTTSGAAVFDCAQLNVTIFGG